jgi:ABC-type multidrug transport system fused ATPase/permease subunit
MSDGLTAAARLMKPYSRRLGYIIAIQAVGAAALALSLGGVAGIVGHLSGQASTSAIGLVGIVENLGSRLPVEELWMRSLIVFATAAILTEAASIGVAVLSARLRGEFLRDVAHRLYVTTANSRYSSVVAHSQERLIHSIAVAPFYAQAVIDSITIVSVALQIVIVFTIIALISEDLILILAGFACIALLIGRFIGLRTFRRLSQGLRDASSQQLGVANESSRGLLHVFEPNARRMWWKRFEDATSKYVVSSFVLECVRLSPVYAIAAIGALMLGVGGSALPDHVIHEMGFAGLAVIVAACLQLLRLLPALSRGLSSITMALPYVKEVDNTLSSLQPEAVPSGARKQTITGGLEFRDVNFAHTDRANTLSDVSFRVDAGSILAIVGPSGSGKSTLIDLVLRLFDVDSGSIVADNTDVRELELEHWRSAIALVGQSPFLFEGTVEENIRIGCPGASIEEVEDAARAASIHDVISGLPGGYQTPVGFEGTRLSTGQRARLAIARALLARPQILILDEATRSLDLETESKIMGHVESLRGETTVLFVTHRLNTARVADRIVVLENGRVHAHGGYEELLEGNTLVRSLAAEEGMTTEKYFGEKDDTDHTFDEDGVADEDR